MDLRVEKTYISLWEAFCGLMREKPFDKIAVKELCAKARIRTATFYNHFSDKYDFFGSMMHFESVRYVRGIRSDDEKDIISYFTYYIRNALDFLEKNADFLMTLVNDNALQPILGLAGKRLKKDIASRLRRGNGLRVSVAAEPELIAAFCAGALEESFSWWFDRRRTVSKEDMIEKLIAILSSVISPSAETRVE